MKYALLLLLLFTIPMVSCTDEDGARAALEAEGFTNIQFTGYSAWSCGRDDASCTVFTAKGPTGKRATGAVGCGFGGCSKNCTVRIGRN